MAIRLDTDINDLKERLANIVVAYRYDRTPVYVRDLEIEGALTLFLKMPSNQLGTDNREHQPGKWWSIRQHRSRM